MHMFLLEQGGRDKERKTKRKRVEKELLSIPEFLPVLFVRKTITPL